MLNRQIFFERARDTLFNGSLTQNQVNGMWAILDEWERRQLEDLRWLAYMLATAFHETATKMTPVIETCRPDEIENPSVDRAIARLENAWAKGQLPWVKRPYWRKNEAGLSYLGRGLPQLTHEANYAKLSPFVDIDLVANPDAALEIEPAIIIMFEGMLRGLFTGSRLDQFFHANDNDPVGARRIINGREKAEHIAGVHNQFFEALLAAA